MTFHVLVGGALSGGNCPGVVIVQGVVIRGGGVIVRG